MADRHEAPDEVERVVDLEARAESLTDSVGFLSHSNRHLKTRWLDPLEVLLSVIGATLLFLFTFAVAFDVLSRNLGTSYIWLQEITLGSFVWGIFIGSAIALRRSQHFYITRALKQRTGLRRIIGEVISLGAMLVIFFVVVRYGLIATQNGMRVSLQVSERPLATLLAAVPTFGALGIIFTLEELIQGFRGGFWIAEGSVGAVMAPTDRRRSEKEGEA